jgi:hypothetical protein
MTAFADLEISLHRYDARKYSIDFRFSTQDSDADSGLPQGHQAFAEFEFEKLDESVVNPESYSKVLTQSLFNDEVLRTNFLKARASASANEIPLRFRLFISPSAPDLQHLKWELLCDPEDSSRLSTNPNVHFSRYMSSLDWHPVRLRPKGDLRALILVANPDNASEYDMAPIDCAAEIEQAVNSLSKIQVDVLARVENAIGRPTLESLRQSLLQLTKGYDIIYFICHGRSKNNQSFLFLENDQGLVDRVSGGDLATLFRQLPVKSRLVVLASCQSSSMGSGDALSAIGPRLIEVGIPAVVAMQGSVTIETVSRLMPVFFKELQRDGRIDRAMAVARTQVQDRDDFWMPALFMRLKSGRLWYLPGRGGEEGEKFEKFPTEISIIKKQRCTPILGPGLLESFLDSRENIAQSWAEAYRYPLAPHERGAMHQVSQYLSINQSRHFPLDTLQDHLKRMMIERYHDELPEHLRSLTAPLLEMFESVGEKQRSQNEQNPYRILADLPLSIYVTTTQDTLIESALRHNGKKPKALICPWNKRLEQETELTRLPVGYIPSVEEPLVYYIFGRWDVPDSIVLTEDNFFDFLIGFSRNEDLIPPQILKALANTGLLFIGFRTDDWNFRILLRSILALPGGKLRDDYPQVAVQIEPDDDQILEPERARKYLEQYFQKAAELSIYWGTAEEFFKDLWSYWQKS